MKKFIGLFLLCSCTMMTVNQVHTEGEASDVVDDQKSPTVSPQFEVPVTLPVNLV